MGLIVITKVKFSLFMLCSIVLISGCGDDSSGDDRYRLVDTLGNTLEHVEPSENITANKTIKIVNDDSGGAASLASILNFLFEYSFSESDVNEELMLYGNHGQTQPPKFSFYDMKQFVESLSHQANGYTYDDLCSFEDFDSDEISTVLGAALLPIQIDDYRHFAVLQGYDENYVYFSSPLAGKICFSYAVFCSVNYSEEVFVVWPNGINPLSKGSILPSGKFKRFL